MYKMNAGVGPPVMTERLQHCDGYIESREYGGRGGGVITNLHRPGTQKPI